MRRLCGTAIVAVMAALLIASCSSQTASSPEGGRREGGSPYPNGDIANRRHSTGSIDEMTVSDLAPAWRSPATPNGELGAFFSSPVAVDGMVYSQDLSSNVKAMEADSGDVAWSRRFDSPTTGPNGVVVSGDRVYGSTARDAFALDRSTGREIWRARLAVDAGEQVGMAPGYHDGMVYLSTRPAAFEGGERGVLWALDARTGRKVWRFDTVPKDLWGDPRTNFGGGVSNPPAFDDRGSMYFGVGGPGPLPGTKRFPWGASRPGPNLYTNSLVKLDAKTGKLQWHYQLTPHAICVWDLQGSPILLDAGGRHLAIAAGKAGIVIALDRQTGELVWRKPVGRHNGHDDDGLQAMRGDYGNLQLPMTVFPGSAGGVLGALSTDGSRIFVPVIDHSTTLYSQTEAGQEESDAGELVALDAASGRTLWRHRFPHHAASGSTSSVNDLVFATTADGALYAFNGEDGKEAWHATLPAGTYAGLGFDAETLIAPAGYGATPALAAYRLDG